MSIEEGKFYPAIRKDNPEFIQVFHCIDERFCIGYLEVENIEDWVIGKQLPDSLWAIEDRRTEG